MSSTGQLPSVNAPRGFPMIILVLLLVALVILTATDSVDRTGG